MVKEKVLYKAIVSFCISCSGGKKTEVRLCQIKDCALYPHRLGENNHGPKKAKKAGQNTLNSFSNKKIKVATIQTTSKQRTKRPQTPLPEKQGISSRSKSKSRKVGMLDGKDGRVGGKERRYRV